MAQLQLGVPLKTREAVIEGPANLPVGRYRVQLVASGRSGDSAPVELQLTVVRARIRPVTPAVPPVVGPVTPVRPVIPLEPVTPLRPVIPVRPLRPR